jgi:hypothetical protein
MAEEYNFLDLNLNFHFQMSWGHFDLMAEDRNSLGLKVGLGLCRSFLGRNLDLRVCREGLNLKGVGSRSCSHCWVVGGSLTGLG